MNAPLVTWQDVFGVGLPETVMCVAGLAVLTLDFAVRSGRNAWLGYLSLVGVGLTGLALIPGWGQTQTGYNGLLVADPFAAFFKVVVLLAAALTILIAIQYLETEGADFGEFYAVVLFSTLGMMLMVSTLDLLMIYLGLETMSISIYLLTGFFKRSQRSTEAALKYLLMGAFSSGIILYGMVFLYGFAGSLNLKDIGAAVAREGAGNPALLVAMVLLTAGFGFKVAAVPFHMYLPDVYEGAPTPVAAFLAGGSEVASIAVLIRLFAWAIPGLQDDAGTLLWVLAFLTMTIGNVVAIAQKNIKRMLAYSSIAHVGYVLIGITVGTPLAYRAVLFYSFAYCLMKLGAFGLVCLLCRGEVKGDLIEDFDGLMQRSPWAAVSMLIFLLSLTGIPPTAGFFGKLYLFGAAIEAGYVWLAVIGVVNSAISAFYYLNVVRAMFMTEAPERAGAPSLRWPGALLVANAAAAAGTLLFGLYPTPVYGFITNLVKFP
jgi:NADH-quinone oxidoreductase subunit N